MTPTTPSLPLPTTDAITYNDDGTVATYRVGSDTYAYTYNSDGRITLIKKNSVLHQSYGYYANGQLRRENNLDSSKTVLYTYDSGGNITQKDRAPVFDLRNRQRRNLHRELYL